jgi:hypothetical protein
MSLLTVHFADSVSKAAVNMWLVKLARELEPVCSPPPLASSSLLTELGDYRRDSLSFLSILDT